MGSMGIFCRICDISVGTWGIFGQYLVVHRGRIRGISRTHPGDISVTSEGHLGHIWKTSGSADDCRPGTDGMIFGRRG
jgi:hypothetical protein